MRDQKGEFQKEGDKVLLEATFKQYRPSWGANLAKCWGQSLQTEQTAAYKERLW